MLHIQRLPSPKPPPDEPAPAPSPYSILQHLLHTGSVPCPRGNTKCPCLNATLHSHPMRHHQLVRQTLPGPPFDASANKRGRHTACRTGSEATRLSLPFRTDFVATESQRDACRINTAHVARIPYQIARPCPRKLWHRNHNNRDEWGFAGLRRSFYNPFYAPGTAVPDCFLIKIFFYINTLKYYHKTLTDLIFRYLDYLG